MLDILPAGGTNQNSSDLIAAEQIRELLKIIESSAYDFVLIDTPPLQGS